MNIYWKNVLDNTNHWKWLHCKAEYIGRISLLTYYTVLHLQSFKWLYQLPGKGDQDPEFKYRRCGRLCTIWNVLIFSVIWWIQIIMELGNKLSDCFISGRQLHQDMLEAQCWVINHPYSFHFWLLAFGGCVK